MRSFVSRSLLLAGLGAGAVRLLGCSSGVGHATPSGDASVPEDVATRDVVGDTDAFPADAAMRADSASPNAATIADASPIDVGQPDAASAEDGAPPAGVYGVTLDDITGIADSVAALAALPHRATTRIVFDEGQAPAYYAQAVPAVHAVSDVMGEILDSQFVRDASVAAYTQRTSDYLAAFPGSVDIWEVGNEINGNWLEAASGGPADVAAKMTGAFDLVKSAGGRTALTLYGCSDSDAAHDMFSWVDAHVPARMRSGLDFVLVSYYEGDCGAPRSDWPAVFRQLRAQFPASSLGFGECGAVDSKGGEITDVAAETAYLDRYYRMSIAEPGYVGGYFWWFFHQEMVPKTKPMFAVLSAAVQ